MDVPSSKRLRPDQRFCPHCDRILSYKTFNTHRRLHYDTETDKWVKIGQSSADKSMDEESPPVSPKEQKEDHIEDSPSSISYNEDPPLSEPGSLPSDSDSDHHHTSGLI